MNFPSLQVCVTALCCVTLCRGQVPDSPQWWDLLTTTAPDTRDPELLPYYDDTVDESDICCECVPFYLCSEDNTIIADGGDIIGVRIGGNNRVQNVETCPDVTQLCCRPPTAPADCVVNGTSPSTNGGPPGPNTPCDCTHWEFCPQEMRISDGSAPTTFIDDSEPLEKHAKCLHSLEVCCAFDTMTPVPPPVTLPSTPESNNCLCVNPWLCGKDGFIVTGGEDLLNLRASSANVPPCVPPQVCCREPQDDATSTTIGTPPRVATTEMPAIEDQTCNGVRNRKGISVRIAGFNAGESQFGEFPWAGMVLRTYLVAGTPMNAFLGGAILINPNVVLTAAHKVANEATASLSVRVGEWDIETDYEPGMHQVRMVESIIIHPNFNNKTLYHDVALLILSEPVVLYPHIRSICLATSVDEVDQTSCVANGWGEDSFNTGNYQTVMKSVTLPLVPSRRCQALLRKTRLGRWFRLHPSFICAGGEAGVDACTSDGGGPLACPVLGSTTGEYLLVGITAWGIGCGEAGVPGVYASTMADNRWIMTEVEGRFPPHSAARREVGDNDENGTRFEAENHISRNENLIKKTTLEPTRCRAGSRDCSLGASVPLPSVTQLTTTASTTQGTTTAGTQSAEGRQRRTQSRRKWRELNKLRRRQERERKRRERRGRNRRN